MSLEDLLKSLQIEYLASLPTKVQQIQTQIEANDNSGLRESFHKLKGTGRTYGLPEVSQLCAVVEQICTQSPAHAGTASSKACHLLMAIHTTRTQQNAELNLTLEPAFAEIQKLLQR